VTADGPGPSRASGVGAFVRARRTSWERLAELVSRVDSGRLSLDEVEELDRLYRRAAGDLARARAAFPGTDAEGYLSQVAARAYGALYRRRRGGLGAALRLARDAAPAAFQAHLPALGLAFAFLAAGLAGGALAVALDPLAAQALVPPEVRDAVAAGHLWTEGLLSAAPGFTGSAIAHNNVSASALVFALGLTFGAGTAWLLFANGLLLGAVAVHCLRNGLGGPFFGFVAAHGPAELSAFLLAGQAGFVLAGALVDPGEWPRGAALAARGREAARLLAVAVPVLALAALLEAVISADARFGAAVKGVAGLGLGAALWAWLLSGGGRTPR